MGIRVHKVMGYGLLRCKFENDPRFNSHVFDYNNKVWNGDLRPKLVAYINKRLKKPSKDEYADTDRKIEKAAILRKGLYENLPDKDIEFHDVVCFNHYDTEGDGYIGPVVLTIPYQTDWYRYDNSIDYHEETHTTEGQLDRVQLIRDCEGQSSGIYPWCSSYVHRDTGKRWIGGSTVDRWSLTKMFRENREAKFKPDNKMGIDSFIEWQRYIVPKLPPFIELFCDCFKIFKNPKTKYRLRPMIFTYWS